MRILLINSSSKENNCLPVGLYAIKTYIEKKSEIKADILDVYMRSKEKAIDISSLESVPALIKYLEQKEESNETAEALNKVIEETQFDSYSIVGISVTDLSFHSSLCIARCIKKQHPLTKIVLGGSIIFSKEILAKFEFLDFIIKGRGEESLLQLCLALKEGKPLPGVFNLIYRGKTSIIETPSKTFLIQDSPAIEFGVATIKQYFDQSLKSLKLSKPVLPYFFIDGCINKCSFCRQSHKQKFNVKPISQIISDLKEMKARHGTNFFMFLNNMLNLSDSYLKRLAQAIIESKTGILWSDSVVPNIKKKEIMQLLAKSGCVYLCWGVESGSQRVVNSMNKPIDVSMCSLLLQEAHNYGIWNVVNIIVNYPQEKESDILATSKFIQSNAEFIDELHLTDFALFPDSEIFKNPLKFGIELQSKLVPRDMQKKEFILHDEHKFNEINGADWEKRKLKTAEIKRAYQISHSKARNNVSGVSKLILYELYSLVGSKTLVYHYLDYLYNTVKVINIGYACNNNCIFCGVSHKKYTLSPSLKTIKEDISKFKVPYRKAVIIGGEPTIRNDLFGIINSIKSSGYRRISIQTNGRRLSNKEFCSRIAKAGVDEFIVSLHTSNEKKFAEFSRVDKSYQQTIEGIRNLREQNTFVKINVVISKENYEELRILAEFLCTLRVNEVRFSMISMVGNASKNVGKFGISISKIVKHLIDACLYLSKNKIQLEFEGIPKCIFNCEDSKTILGLYKENVFADRKAKGKPCESCKYSPLCAGPWQDYTNRMGWGEFHPIKQ